MAALGLVAVFALSGCKYVAAATDWKCNKDHSVTITVTVRPDVSSTGAMTKKDQRAPVEFWFNGKKVWSGNLTIHSGNVVQSLTVPPGRTGSIKVLGPDGDTDHANNGTGNAKDPVVDFATVVNRGQCKPGSHGNYQGQELG